VSRGLCEEVLYHPVTVCVFEVSLENSLSAALENVEHVKDICGGCDVVLVKGLDVAISGSKVCRISDRRCLAEMYASVTGLDPGSVDEALRLMQAADERGFRLAAVNRIPGKFVLPLFAVIAVARLRGLSMPLKGVSGIVPTYRSFVERVLGGAKAETKQTPSKVAQTVVEKLVAAMNLGREVEEKAKKFVEEMYSVPKLTKSPSVVAATAVYIASRRKVTQALLSSVAGVVEVSVRNLLKTLKDVCLRETTLSVCSELSYV